MRRLLFIAALPMLLSACAVSSPTYREQLLRGGDVRLDVADSDAYQYKLSVKNSFDVAYDGGKAEDRLALAQGLLERSCKSIDVLSTQVIEGGTNFVGREVRWFVMKIRCIN